MTRPVFTAIRGLLDDFDAADRRRSHRPAPPLVPDPRRDRCPHPRRPRPRSPRPSRDESIAARVSTRCAPRSAAARSASAGRRPRRSVSCTTGPAARPARRWRSPSSSAPSSARRRRTIPSTCPANPNTIPLRIASTVDLPISARGASQLDLGQLGGPLVQGVDRDLGSRRDDPAQVLARGGDRVVGDRGAEVDHDARVADPLVGGHRVDEPVGADLARVVDPDRHARCGSPAPPPASGGPGSGRTSRSTALTAGAPSRRRSRRRCRRRPDRAARAGSTAPRRARRGWTRAPWRSASARRPSSLRRGRRRNASGCCRRRRRAAWRRHYGQLWQRGRHARGRLPGAQRASLSARRGRRRAAPAPGSSSSSGTSTNRRELTSRWGSARRSEL